MGHNDHLDDGEDEDEFERPTIATVEAVARTAYDAGFVAALKCSLGLVLALPKPGIEHALKEMLAVMGTKEDELEDGPEPDEEEQARLGSLPEPPGAA